jgi:threonine/homoserine/homoserine lactone efflux protein
MTTPLLFVPAALAVLLVPGPTNTLLASAGLTRGFAKAWPLVFLELLGYLTTITVVTLASRPIMQDTPAIAVAMRLICAPILLVNAVKLWRFSPGGQAAPVRPLGLFLATLFNPKGLVFAFVIMPQDVAPGSPGFLACLALLGALILGAGTTWIAAGALLLSWPQTARRPKLMPRVGALVLSTFAILVTLSAIQH